MQMRRKKHQPLGLRRSCSHQRNRSKLSLSSQRRSLSSQESLARLILTSQCCRKLLDVCCLETSKFQSSSGPLSLRSCNLQRKRKICTSMRCSTSIKRSIMIKASKKSHSLTRRLSRALARRPSHSTHSTSA